MISILGELIIDINCDKCGRFETHKTFLDERENQLITVPLPKGWYRNYYRERWQFWCEHCLKLHGSSIVIVKT